MRNRNQDFGICRNCGFRYLCKGNKCRIIKKALDGISKPRFKYNKINYIAKND